MPIDKRTGKYYPAEEGYGDKTDPLPGMLDPISQARQDRMEAMNAASRDAAGNVKMEKSMQTEQKRKAKIPGMKRGGSVGSASKRADGCAQRGKTKGKMV